MHPLSVFLSRAWRPLCITHVLVTVATVICSQWLEQHRVPDMLPALGLCLASVWMCTGLIRLSLPHTVSAMVLLSASHGLEVPTSWPAPAPGWWLGHWEGLPGRHSALFLPIQRWGDRPLDDVDRFCARAPLGYKIRVSALPPPQRYRPAPGQCVLMQLRAPAVKPPMPSSESFQRWERRHGIAGRLSLSRRMPEVRVSVDAGIDGARLWLRDRFSSAGTDMPRQSGLSTLPVLLALVTGDRVLMGPWHWSLFARTGTSHLMAISGSHITLLAAFAYACFGRLMRRVPARIRRWPAPVWAGLLSWAVAFGYCMVSGMGVPAQRTLAMVSVALLFRARGWRVLSWDTWWLAACAVVLVDPLAALDLGAWMSFLAVAVIITVSGGRLTLPGALWVWIRVQWAIFVGLIPVLVYAFGGFPLVSLVANIVAIPVIGWGVVPLAMLAACLSWTPDAILHTVLWCAAALLDLQLMLLQWMDAWPGDGFRVVPPSFLSAALAMVGVLMLLQPKGSPGRILGASFLLPILAGPGSDGLPVHRVTPLPERRVSLIIEDGDTVRWLRRSGGDVSQARRHFEAWLVARGIAMHWRDEAMASMSWTKSGWTEHRFVRQAYAWGQVRLSHASVHYACARKGNGDVLPGKAEADCWWRTTIGPRRVVLSTSMARDAQLIVARAPEAPAGQADLLIADLKSGERITGAVLNRLRPRAVSNWTAQAPLLACCRDRLAARNILPDNGWVEAVDPGGNPATTANTP